jgi:hypothetical protein
VPVPQQRDPRVAPRPREARPPLSAARPTIADVSGNRLEDVPVQVLVDGQWLDGWLDTWDKRAGRWTGFVRYQTAPAENYLGWFVEDCIRRLG